VIKNLDKYILKKIGPPFLVAFFISLFVLMMQVLMVYIKSLLGKGVSNLELLELIGYLTISLIPRALPLAILIAMVMVFGNLSEKYELATMKSAGISLQRILVPALAFGLFISAFSYYCSNTIIPITNLKWMTRLSDIRNQKPALSLEEGVFNYDFGGYAIKISKRNDETGELSDIMIYDHKNVRQGVVNIITADRGKMYTTPDQKFLVMELFNGYQLQELKENPGEKKRPTVRSRFDSYTKMFDMTQFELNNTDEERYNSLETMISASQLMKGLDSLREVNQQISDIMTQTVRNFEKQREIDTTEVKNTPKSRSPSYQNRKKSVQEVDLSRYRSPNTSDTVAADSTYFPFPDSIRPRIFQFIPPDKWNSTVSRANGIATSRFNSLRSASFKTERLVRSTAKHYYELNTKFSTALMCLIFVLIGAPMGAIIRKGGYGYPLLVSIIFFMLYIVLFILTGQLSKSLTMNPILAAWLPNAVLLPIGLFLSYKATQDSKFDAFKRAISTVKGWIKKE